MEKLKARFSQQFYHQPTFDAQVDLIRSKWEETAQPSIWMFNGSMVPPWVLTLLKFSSSDPILLDNLETYRKTSLKAVARVVSAGDDPVEHVLGAYGLEKHEAVSPFLNLVCPAIMLTSVDDSNGTLTATHEDWSLRATSLEGEHEFLEGDEVSLQMVTDIAVDVNTERVEITGTGYWGVLGYNIRAEFTYTLPYGFNAPLDFVGLEVIKYVAKYLH